MNEITKYEGFNNEQVDLIKSTIAVGSTDNELKLFLYTAQKSGLDPLAKQIHFVKRNVKKEDGTYKSQMSIQTGIDGYRLIADRTGKYAGNDEPIYDDENTPRKASVTVYKMVDGVRCPFTATARWEQYFPGEKQGFMWKKMPHLMLGKCAEALALRKAFPAELSGLYTTDEMAQADHQPHVVEVEPKYTELPPNDMDAEVIRGREVSETVVPPTDPKENTPCPNCPVGTMKLRNGKNGPFLACNAYPDCKTTYSLNN